MNLISHTLGDDHRHCDQLFADAEAGAAAGDWNVAADRFTAFRRDMEHHLGFEEQTLFPAIEAHFGGPMGPTGIMRMEHAQMREVMRAMAEAAAGGDQSQFLGLADSLLMLMQQHNLKEEQILYPMMDQALAPQAPTLLEGWRA